MPFDAPRWQIELSAVDKTAAAFSSATGRMNAFSKTSAAVGRQTSESFTAANVAAKAGAAAYGHLQVAVGQLAAAYGVVAIATKVWEAGMKAADIGEQAEQIGVTSDQLQAYRFAAAQAGIETEQIDTAITKLAKSMGTAADGNKEMIERFQSLGVKLLDAKGQLRSAADVLPEVAKGILGIGSTSQRTATLMELFGRSGAKMTTVLEELAKGNDAVVASAQKQGGILDPAAIKAWDDLADAMVRAKLQADVTFASLGAPIATEGLSVFTQYVNTAKDAVSKLGKAWSAVRNFFTNDSTMDLSARQDTLRAQLANIKDSTDPLDVAKVSQIKRDLAAISDTLASRANVVTMPPVTVSASAPGVSNPTPKGGGTDPYKKLIDDAKQYVALKKAETEGIGLNDEAAARLKHTQELLGKATAANIALTPQVTAELTKWANAMADADAAFGKAKFLDDATKKATEFIAAQQIERDTLWMSQEAADAYRLTQEQLNKAKAEGITLGAAEIDKLRELAAQQAAASQKTREAKELYDLAKDSFTGFISDVNQGLKDGKSIWDSFGNAASNALDKISSKLLDMAAKQLFEAAFGGGPGSGSSGFLGSLFGGLFGGGGGVTAGAGPAGGYGGFEGYALTLPGFASGGNYPAGMPRIVGENGPEIDIPSRGGTIYNQQQLASMLGGSTRVEIHLKSDMLDARIANGANVQIVKAQPAIESAAVSKANKAVPSVVATDHAERGGDHRL